MRRVINHWSFLPITLASLFWVAFVIFSRFPVRVDLTADHRFTLSDKTSSVLASLDAPLEIRIYLGENRKEVPLPPAYRQLNSEVDILMDNFRKHAAKGVAITHVNLEESPIEKEALNAARKFPVLHSTERGAERILSQVYPYAAIGYKGQQIVIDLISSQAVSNDNDVAESLANMEHRFYQGIAKLLRPSIPRIAIASGHGELSSGGSRSDLDDLGDLLGADAFFALDTVYIDNELSTVIPETVDLLIIAQPKSPVFSEVALKSIDDFVMKGGNLIMFLDPCFLQQEARFKEFVAGVDLGLGPLLSSYGLRLNKHLVQNFNCVRQELPTGGSLDGLSLEQTRQPELKELLWPFFGLFDANTNHATGQIDAPVLGRYASTLDIKHRRSGIDYTPLLSTSPYVNYFPEWNTISLTEFARDSFALSSFEGEQGVIAYLLEGDIPSHYDIMTKLNGEYRTSEAKVMVFADGDMIQGGLGEMGVHTTSEAQTRYGNRDFLRNCVEYILGEEEMIPHTTSFRKDVYMDTERLSRTRSKWLWINFLTPLLSLLGMGGLVYYIRRQRAV